MQMQMLFAVRSLGRACLIPYLGLLVPDPYSQSFSILIFCCFKKRRVPWSTLLSSVCNFKDFHFLIYLSHEGACLRAISTRRMGLRLETNRGGAIRATYCYPFQLRFPYRYDRHSRSQWSNEKAALDSIQVESLLRYQMILMALAACSQCMQP